MSDPDFTLVGEWDDFLEIDCPNGAEDFTHSELRWMLRFDLDPYGEPDRYIGHYVIPADHPAKFNAQVIYGPGRGTLVNVVQGGAPAGDPEYAGYRAVYVGHKEGQFGNVIDGFFVDASGCKGKWQLKRRSTA